MRRIVLPSVTAMSQLKDRLLHPWTNRDDPKVKANLPSVARPRPVGFPASIAEFLLVFRLKARRRSALSTDMLERAVRVIFVTCKHWFADTDRHKPSPRRYD